MSHSLFFLSDTNPNDTSGGGGCLCSPTRSPDTRGPYVVIPSNDMEAVVSPHVVVCAECFLRLKELFEHGEAGDVGERGKSQQLPANQPRGDDNRQYSEPVDMAPPVGPEADWAPPGARDDDPEPRRRRPRSAVGAI